jgi:SAM-dependent methyltransferase
VEKTIKQESVIPALGAPFFADHLARYWFATKYCRLKKVLDVGCGKGYGSMALATVAESITGIDSDEKSLEFAREHYTHPRITFRNTDVTRPFDLSHEFDVAVAFEIIEHLQPSKVDDFLKRLVDGLHSGGLALISTPNHAVVAASGVSVPDFHINNMTASQFKSSLEKHFVEVNLFGQLKSKGLLKNLIYGLDLFHLRHLKLFKSLKVERAMKEQAEDYPFFWRPEHGWGESSNFIFSPRLWRSAGQVLAVCRRR